MPFFGKKKDKDKRNKPDDEGLNLDDLSLENLDEDDDNEDSDTEDDEEKESALLKQALRGLDAESDDDEDDESDGSEDSEEDDDYGGVSSDLLDIFTDEEEVDSDLAALTQGLDDVDAASLLTQAQEIVEAFRRIKQT